MKKRGANKIGKGNEILLEIVFFTLAVILTIYFWESIGLLTLLLLVLWVIAINLWHSKKDIVVFVVAAILGPIAEIFIINFGGAWYYSKPLFLGIPLWLPFLWGFSGLLLYRLANTLYDSRIGR